MPLQNRVTPLGDLIADPGAWARLRQPRLPPRRGGAHPPALRRQALDRLPARVPRLAPRAADAARPLHGALLPRRGDGIRRRASALRALSPRGLRPLPRDRRRARRGRDRRSPPRRAGRPGDARPTPARRGLDELPDGAFVLRAASRGSCSAPSCCAGRRRVTPTEGGVPRASAPCSSRPRRSSRSCAPGGSHSCRCCTLRRDNCRVIFEPELETLPREQLRALQTERLQALVALREGASAALPRAAGGRGARRHRVRRRPAQRSPSRARTTCATPIRSGCSRCRGRRSSGSTARRGRPES